MLGTLLSAACDIKQAQRLRGKLKGQLAGMQCLKEDTAYVLDLLSELLLTPSLPDDKIQLNKNQVGLDDQPSLPCEKLDHKA